MSYGLTEEQRQYMECEKTEQYTCAKLTMLVNQLLKAQEEMDKKISELQKRSK